MWPILIGGEILEIALEIRMKSARDVVLSNDFGLGGDLSVAAGPVGAGAKAQIMDVPAFART